MQTEMKLVRRDWWETNETDHILNVTDNIYIELIYCETTEKYKGTSNSLEIDRNLISPSSSLGNSVEELMAEATNIANEYIKTRF